MTTPADHTTAVRQKQDGERKARRQTAAKAPVATVKAKRTPPKKQASGTSKAQTVRAYLEAHPEARDFEVAKATGIVAAYVWDIRAAMKRTAAKAQEAAKNDPPR